MDKKVQEINILICFIRIHVVMVITIIILIKL